MAAGKGSGSSTRKVASPEVVQRRRDARRLTREAKEKRNSPQPMPRRLSIGVTALTMREVKKFREIADPLFERGEISLKYNSVRYLELIHLGWTKADLDCRADDFEEVWAWWTQYLDQADRQSVIAESRFSRTVA